MRYYKHDKLKPYLIQLNVALLGCERETLLLPGLGVFREPELDVVLDQGVGDVEPDLERVVQKDVSLRDRH